MIMTKKYFFIYSVLMASTAIISCNNPKEVEPKEQAICVSDSMRPMIALDTAKITNVSDELTLTGEVSFDADRVVRVFSFSSGQVQEVKVSLGDKVFKGQVLAIIKSADISGTYSDLRSAKSDVAIAKRQLENVKSLYEKGINSEKEYMEARENYNKALAAGQKLTDIININGGGHTQPNGTYSVTAPADGYIVEKNITTGSFIRSDNATNLFTTSSLDNVWIWANVFEADIPRIKQGYEALVSTLAYPGVTFHAHIDRTSEVLDPQDKVMRIRINLPNEHYLLKPDMFANITILFSS
jgi:cobalt-zinc-cadmium efflux system membrane fusion protein